MNILLVSNGFPPTTYGGVEGYTFDIANGLFNRGHKVSIFCREPAAKLADYELLQDDEAPYPIYRVVNDFKRVDTISKLYSDPKIDAIFETLIGKVQPEVVHFNHFIALSSNLPHITFQQKIPSVISLHDYWPICHRINLINGRKKLCGGPKQGGDCYDCVILAGEKNSGYRNLILYYLKQLLPYSMRFSLGRMIRRPGSDAMLFRAHKEDFEVRYQSFLKALVYGSYLTTPSQFVRKTFQQNGYEDLDIHVLPLGIEKLPFLSRGGPHKKINFAFVGTILSIKGVDIVVKAFSRVQSQNIEFSIFGREDVDPHFKNYLHNAAKNDARIHFKGPFSPGNKEEIYRQIDVLVVPSIWHETFSYVAREALESGIPVVASSMGALTEIIKPGKNGFLFPSGDVLALSKIIFDIAQNPDLLSNLDCPGGIEILNVDEHLTRLEGVYSKLINR